MHPRCQNRQRSENWKKKPPSAAHFVRSSIAKLFLCGRGKKKRRLRRKPGFFPLNRRLSGEKCPLKPWLVSNSWYVCSRFIDHISLFDAFPLRFSGLQMILRVNGQASHQGSNFQLFIKVKLLWGSPGVETACFSNGKGKHGYLSKMRGVCIHV